MGGTRGCQSRSSLRKSAVLLHLPVSLLIESPQVSSYKCSVMFQCLLAFRLKLRTSSVVGGCQLSAPSLSHSSALTVGRQHSSNISHFFAQIPAFSPPLIPVWSVCVCVCSMTSWALAGTFSAFRGNNVTAAPSNMSACLGQVLHRETEII